METEIAEIVSGLESEIKVRVQEIRVLASWVRVLKGRRGRRGYGRGGRKFRRRAVGGADATRDITEQLNYVASQLWGACKNPLWGDAHEVVLREASREIRRLRSVVYTSKGTALGPPPKMQHIGPQAASAERDAWLARLTDEERTADRQFGRPLVQYELDAVRLRRGGEGEG